MFGAFIADSSKGDYTKIDLIIYTKQDNPDYKNITGNKYDCDNARAVGGVPSSPNATIGGKKAYFITLPFNPTLDRRRYIVCVQNNSNVFNFHYYRDHDRSQWADKEFVRLIKSFQFSGVENKVELPIGIE